MIGGYCESDAWKAIRSISVRQVADAFDLPEKVIGLGSPSTGTFSGYWDTASPTSAWLERGIFIDTTT